MCNDNDLCTDNDKCVSGTCIGQTKTCPANKCKVPTGCNPMTGQCSYTDKDCSALDSDCIMGVCDMSTGSCKRVPRNVGNSCSNPDIFCKVGLTCQANGECGGGTDKDCTQEVGTLGMCQLATCNPITKQ